MSDIRFDDKVVIVTGAGGGIGRAHALLFAKHGAKVVVNDLGGSTNGEGANSEAALKVVEEIKAAGGTAIANPDNVINGDRIVEVVCDMSPAFLAAIGETFEQANVTVDWFHVVQLFTRAVDNVRKAEAKHNTMPKALRWAVLKAGDRTLTDDQRHALAELETGGFATAAAYRAKEMLRWIRHATTPQAARWRITRFINHIGLGLDPTALLDPVRKALRTFSANLDRILQRWTSSHSNARLEGLNGIFQAARSRARGYRDTATFVTIIYLLAAPLPDIFKST